MKVFQCGPGNRRCGKRCIPQSQRCRLEEGDENSTQLDLDIEYSSLSNERKKLVKKVGIALGATFAAAALIGTGIAIHKNQQISAGLGVSFEDSREALTQASVTVGKSVAEATGGLKSSDDFVEKLIIPVMDDPELPAGWDGTLHTSLLDPELKDKLDPGLLELAEKRGVDLSKVAYIEYSYQDLEDEGLNMFFGPGGRLIQCEDGSAVIFADRTTGTTNTGATKTMYNSTSDVHKSASRTLNHEVTHYIQMQSGWVMSDSMYATVERFVTPYLGMDPLQGNFEGFDRALAIPEYMSQFDQYGKLLTTENVDSVAARQLARRMEVEAWALNNLKTRAFRDFMRRKE